MSSSFQYQGKVLLDFECEQGEMLDRARGSAKFEQAVVSGKFFVERHFPVALTAPGKKIFNIGSSAPQMKNADAVYCPEQDIVIQFQAERISFSGDKFTISGNKCAIKLLPRYYAKKVNRFFEGSTRSLRSPAPVGWLSWYCYFCDFNEKKLADTLKSAKKLFKDYGLEYVQIEMWQQNSDKLPVSLFKHNLDPDPKKFPKGMRNVAESIKKAGFKAGIWLVPLGTSDEDSYKNNPKFYLIDSKGEPVSSWSGKYSLDPTLPAALKKLKNDIKVITKEWCFDYLKIDGLEMGGDNTDGYYMNNVYHSAPAKEAFAGKNPNPLRKAMKAIREAGGANTYITLCAGNGWKKGELVGLGDASRVGSDVFYDGAGPTWNSTLYTAKVSLSNFHFHNIFWSNDPDVLSVRPPLEMDSVRVLCSILALSGQSLFLSDILDDLPAERVDMLRKIMPTCATHPVQLEKNDFLQPVWNLMIKRDFESWNVLGLFNWDAKKKQKISLKKTELGLENKKEYLLYDFWNDQFLGEFGKKLELTLPAKNCQVLAVREKLGRPQFLSIDRHLSQGAISIKSSSWNEKTSTLSLTFDLPPKDTFSAAFHVPEQFEFDKISGNAELISIEKKIVTIAIKPRRGERTIKLSFSK